MEVGLGALGFPPSVFWDLTYREFQAAFDGWKIAQGHDDLSWTESQVERMKSNIEAMKEKYPDGPVSKDLKRQMKALKKGLK